MVDRAIESRICKPRSELCEAIRAGRALGVLCACVDVSKIMYRMVTFSKTRRAIRVLCIWM